ncbi:probable disease resistance protein RXW24L, partial [Aegilops tauschii subsp. strangulata]|uniref:probable disease resistance protein RXW24L n=1 Tax=Aegilops tauschii subsp. strangulata TaxID=200361 RepID=UPI001E1CA863
NGGHVGASSSHNQIFYRSSFQNLSGQIIQASPNLRTLFGFELSSLSLPDLRFLRVLHVENTRLKNFSTVIGGCIHLRHLSLRGCGRVKVPSSIRKLLYLQTIHVDSNVPSSLWDIPTLRYVDLCGISLPRSVQISQTLQELRMWPTDDEVCKDPMPILEMLPCLVVLELHCFIPETMSIGAQGFPRLQELRLEGCYFNKWTMEVGTMPKLSHLSLDMFDMLDEIEIPDGLLHLPSLSFVSLHARAIACSSHNTVEGLKQKGCKITIVTVPL